jgi:putative transposase
MDQRKQFIADFHRGLQSATGLAVRFDISRKTAYKWNDRHDQNGATA